MVAIGLPGGATLGLATPVVLAVIPVAAVVLYALVFLRAEGAAGRRSRWLFVATRFLLVVLLVAAAAGPYTVESRETQGDPTVTLLVDRSASTNVTDDVAADLAAGIEDAGVPATVATIAQGTDSRIGDGIAANLRENGSVVVLSDGQVTAGRSMTEAAELARAVNATISTVATRPSRTERYVAVDGPQKTSVGVESRFLVRVDGVRTGGAADLTVEIDGEEVLTETLTSEDPGPIEVTHTFDDPGSHRVTATVESDDVYAVNNVYRRTVQVVERPDVLYVGRGQYPFQRYLEELYDVQTARSVPSDLEDYYAVVVQDVAADDLGNVDALQEFVIDGNGLLVVGGNNAYERGGYESAPIASMLPVTFGESGIGSTTIVFAIDVSASAGEGMEVQKAIALDALSQLGDSNAVGIVGFNYQAYRVAAPTLLAQNRSELQDRIRRLQPGGATNIATGLRGARELLGTQQGTIILVSDGHDTNPEAQAVAGQLGRQGTRVVTVGAGPSPNEDVLRGIAQRSGGTYFRADETNRLRLLFGGASRQFSGEGLTIVDSNHFVTSGVTLEADPERVNDVSVRPGADFLVATSDGTPAITSWRYGLGRVASITAYGADGTLDGLLREPDSLVLTKSVNWAIGDPERKESGVTSVADTRVGEQTTITYRGDARPTGTDLSFRAVEDGVYRATVTPTEVGYLEVRNTSYAANYPTEYGAFGQADALTSAVRSTGGQTFQPGQATAIAEFAREQSVRTRDVRTDWAWVLVLLALLLFLTEVVVRRLQVYNGRTRHESGLP